ncbi:MAG TPA: SDR family oxidoreductase [Actinomycetota bacterium]|nr:SDR family oxidoreductase [Actinomycetota bacterium]
MRPERLRDPRTGRVRTLGARQRGALLLRRLGLAGPAARKFRFVEGDVEEPRLGLAPAEVRALEGALTHVVHCAASVAFDDSYENSFRANVLGSRNALDFSLRLQHARGSPFVAHLATETSYVHGRRQGGVAPEARLVFPPRYYNNFYELTKARRPGLRKDQGPRRDRPARMAVGGRDRRHGVRRRPLRRLVLRLGVPPVDGGAPRPGHVRAARESIGLGVRLALGRSIVSRNHRVVVPVAAAAPGGTGPRGRMISARRSARAGSRSSRG